ncbi:MAG: AsmA-like C-terminal region-containing protein [Bacteroidota bacterium]
MKRFLLIVAGILVVVIGALAVLPWFFRDKIKVMVQEDIQKMVDAEVYFGDVGLSFLADFPNACISVQDFGVVGKEVFAKDTLISGQEFSLVVDLNSVISGEEIQIKEVRLNRPRVHAIVLKDGSANWDIFLSDSSATEVDTASSSFQIALQAYELTDGFLRYQDETLPMDLMIQGLRHRGKGDFTAETFVLETVSSATAITTEYDGIKYLNRAVVEAAVNMDIDVSEDLQIDLRDNLLSVNDMSVKVDGSVGMPGDDIDLDLAYAAQKTTFASLFSLIPGVYTADFADIQTDGNLVFDGYVKGRYNETQIPGFGLNLQVDQGSIQYPDVPKPITGILMDLKVDAPAGDLEQMVINLKRLRADLGQNPIDASAEIKGLERMQIIGNLKAKLQLEELTEMFPIEGTELKGLFKVDATANGVYDDAAGSFPQVDGRMALTDGYVKNAEYPAELTEFGFHGELKDVDGALTSAVFDLPDFHFLLDGEPIDGSLHVENFDNPTYLLKARGTLDLAKLLQIYPIDSMELTGRLIVEDFSTAGTYADIEAERYTDLPTSGRVQVQELVYQDAYLTAPVTVQSGTADFTPNRLNISGARGQLGKSDYAVDGYFTNYLAYALLENEPLGGQMSLRSQRFDVNEWMEEEGGGSSSGEEAVAYEVIPVPGNLNVAFDADLKEVLYEDLVLSDMKGSMRVADQAVQMEDVSFGMLGGRVAMSGEYVTTNVRQPSYHFYMNVQELLVEKVAETFTIAQEYAPALKFIDGICNTEFGISGLLGSDMMPVLESVNSLGVFNMLKGGLKNTPMLTSLSEKTQLSQLSQLNLEAAKGQFEIKDGFLIISPIDLKKDDLLITIGGRQNLAGSLDYDLALDAPSGKLDQAAVGALSSLTGTSFQTSDRVQLNLKIGGTTQAPKIRGGKGGTVQEVKDQLVDAAENKLKEETGLDVSLNKDSLKQQAQQTTEVVKDTVKAVVQETKEAVTDTLKAVVDEKKEEAKEVIGDKIEETIGQEAKDQLNNLKDRFGLPKRKKKKK